ncbi:MAG: EamA family transporter, partial [Bdellovibrionaceae bacterium]|nr:EamA family transporter [Pseudobdellovibrionaceae bacterium]
MPLEFTLCHPSQVRTHLIYLFGLVCLSQAANLVRLAQPAPIEVIGFWRLLGAALVMGLIASEGRPLFKRLKDTSSKEMLSISLSSVFFFTHLWTFFYAAHHTQIANCMILFAINPLFTSAGSALLFQEKFRLRHALAWGLALLATVALLSDQLSGVSKLNLGDLSALLSALLFAGYMLSSKKARRTLENSWFTFSIYFLSAILFLFSAFLQNYSLITWPLQTWLAILGLII